MEDRSDRIGRGAAIAAAAGLAAGGLAICWLAPRWVHGGVLYAVFVLATILRPSRAFVLPAAAFGSILVVACAGGDLTGPSHSATLFHSLLWAAAIWITAGLMLRRERVERENRRLFNFSLDLLCVAGEDGLLKEVNPAVEEKLGYPRCELIRMPLSGFVHPDDLETARARFGELRAGKSLSDVELRVRRKDGSHLWVAFTVYPLPEEGRYYCVGRDATVRKRLESELLDREQRLQLLASRLLTAQEEEDARLARELHDGFAQRLVALGVAAAGFKGDAAALRAFLQERLGELEDEIRSLSHRLHPAILDNVGLRPALEAECEAFERVEGIPVLFRVEGRSPEKLEACTTVAIYRVAQESLRNVAKHARARRVQMTVSLVEDEVWLSVYDDGVGFDRERANGYCLGLISMEERMRAVGGRLSIVSRPGQGTEIEASAPIDPDSGAKKYHEAMPSFAGGRPSDFERGLKEAARA